MKVVDASVVTIAVGGTSQRNLETYRRMVGDSLCAPHLLDIEVASALRSLQLRGELQEQSARQSLRHLATLPIVRLPHGPLIERCWELKHNLSSYDAAYVALAEMYETTLLTSDLRLARSPGIRCDVELLT